MTGTADTEAEEFHKIYKLEVMVVPTHKPMIRADHPDAVYRTEPEKFEAAVKEICELYKKGQPVLVGTISIEKSERLSGMLKRLGIPHSVLNAKHHAQEAEIVAQAGQRAAVTISTNMAGRGTDIVLGKGVPDLGGLHIMGTERHEARRIDNQLRGRSGRQGDPGSSRFYLSLEDDLLRLFGSDRIKGIMGKLGMEEGEPIEHNLISKAIENAQRKVEGRNFEIRKHLLEYDDVLNKQREVIYSQRRMALTGEGVHEAILEMIEELAEGCAAGFAQEKIPTAEWDLKGLSDAIAGNLGFKPDFSQVDGMNQEALAGMIKSQAEEVYQRKFQLYGQETMSYLEEMVLLQAVDSLWKDHLLNMDHLKEGIGLRGYGQKDPLREYQREGYEMFEGMIERVKAEAVSTLMRLQLTRAEDAAQFAPDEDVPLSFSGGDDSTPEPQRREGSKVGRNDPCPCGSGKKFKKCCGRK
jgi:preprotein translocase subunit SecA